MTERVKKTRGCGRYTEAAFWGKVRGGLRREFRFWPPILKAKIASRRDVKKKKGNQKFEYQCAHCKDWKKGSEVQVDHIIPVGSLKCSDHLAGFIERLTVEEGYQVLCKECHLLKTKEEKKKK